MATLRVVSTQPTLEQIEHDVLTDVVAALDISIERLPVESTWRWTLTLCRRDIAATVEHLAGQEDD